MTKDELIKQISYQTGLTVKDTKNVVQTVFEDISKALAEGEKVKISGFGTFNVKKRKGFKTKHPATGEIWDIPEHNVPVFEPSKKLKEKVSKSDAT